jgi:hypothetical protein
LVKVIANGWNWAESGLTAFGSTNARSGLSGYDPKAVIRRS